MRVDVCRALNSELVDVVILLQSPSAELASNSK